MKINYISSNAGSSAAQPLRASSTSIISPTITPIEPKIIITYSNESHTVEENDIDPQVVDKIIRQSNKATFG